MNPRTLVAAILPVPVLLESLAAFLASTQLLWDRQVQLSRCLEFNSSEILG